jgi:DNA-binding CsgD family transcriptional regulator
MDEERRFGGWFLLPIDTVPRKWRHRAIDVSLLPLSPGELTDVLAGRAPQPRIDEVDLPLVGLVAEGRSAAEISRVLSIAPRTVYRRIARLRDAFGVQTTAQLAAALAQRGF